MNGLPSIAQEEHMNPQPEDPSYSGAISIARKGCVALMALAAFGCGKKTDDPPAVSAPSASVSASAAPAPSASAEVKKKRQYMFGRLSGIGSNNADLDYGKAGLGGLPPVVAPTAACPPNMVNVDGRFCIDQYETSLYDTAQGRRVSIFYHPNKRHTSERYYYWTHPEQTKAHQALLPIDVPAPPVWQLTENFGIRAFSRPNVKPNGYLNRFRAEEACQNAGKRLCTENEWVFACRGEANQDFPYGDHFEWNKCNVHRGGHPSKILHGDATHYHTDPRLLAMTLNGRPFLEKTGQRKTCASKWPGGNVYDMVGNLDEWVDSPTPTFRGGFFSRNTKRGCQALIFGHPALYYDYSLGTRCCLDLQQ